MSLINNNNSRLSKPVYSFNWPHYRKYWETCFATTTLMLMKGYKKLRDVHELDPQLDSIFKIINKMIDSKLIVNFEKETGATAVSGGKFNKIGWTTGFDDDDFMTYMGRASVPDLIRNYNQLPVRAYTCENLDALINFVPLKISQNKPIKVDSSRHSVLICGYEMQPDSYVKDEETGLYKYNYLNIYFWINDPSSTQTPYKKIHAVEFNQVVGFV